VLTIPTPYAVLHEPSLAGGEDEMGDPIEGYGPSVSVPVYGWAPPSADTEIRPSGTGVVRDIDLYSPTRFCGPGDRVTLPSEPGKFDVIGYPEDYNYGPFRFKPGYRVNLKRAEG